MNILRIFALLKSLYKVRLLFPRAAHIHRNHLHLRMTDPVATLSGPICNVYNCPRANNSTRRRRAHARRRYKPIALQLHINATPSYLLNPSCSFHTLVIGRAMITISKVILTAAFENTLPFIFPQMPECSPSH